jgi:hypothetical protein
MSFGHEQPATRSGLRRLTPHLPGTRGRQRGRTTSDGPPTDAANGDTTDRHGRRPDPVLRWKDPSRAPAGNFSACAVPNGQLRVHAVPERTDTWDAVSSFSLSYDGYAYWDDVSELATRSLRSWTRAHTLPGSIDELRACLFFEQRRWHHFGEEPNGRGAQYVWALLDSLRTLVAARTVDGPRPQDGPDTGSLGDVTPGPVRSFLDDDAGYLAWTSSHTGGFVVNADRTLSPNSLMLHRATCTSIVGPTGTGRRRTANYRKVCASDLHALLDWCRTDIGVDPGHCHRCNPAS